MPFNELQRRDSWPPTIVRIHDTSTSTTTDLDDIDENPISFFLTSPEDVDFFDDEDLEDLSAGIEGSDSKALPIREVSPSSLQRSPLPVEEEQEELEDGEVEFGVGMPLSLKDFTARHINNSGRQSRTGERSADESLKGLGIAIPEFKAKRGRAKVRLTPNHGRGRGKTRSLSARRPQSWRVPSPDIWSIQEEREEDIINMGLSASAPATAQIEQMATAEPKKSKKRVHWAI
jgi:hypothetical protein